MVRVPELSLWSFRANQGIEALRSLEAATKLPLDGDEQLFLDNLGRGLEAQPNIPITPEIIRAYFVHPASSQFLRACAAYSMQSREISIHQQMASQDSRRFVADEYGTVFSSAEQSFLHTGPFNIGDAMPERRPVSTESRQAQSELTVSEHRQGLIVHHAHPPFVKDQVLGPSVLIKVRDETGALLEPMGDLMGICHTRLKRVDALRNGVRSKDTRLPIWGIIQAGDSVHEEVKLLWMQETELLARLGKDEYYLWLIENLRSITEAESDQEIDAALRNMGYIVARTSFEGPHFWFVANIFIERVRNDLMSIFSQPDRSLQLERFVGRFGL